MLDKYIEEYNEAIFDTDRDRALDVVRKAVEDGVTPEEVVFDIVLPAMDLMVAIITESMDSNLAQQFMGAQIADTVTTEMIARFKKHPDVLGTVVIGTAQNDMHSLGKRIVTGCLKARMINVVDIGVNVSPESFVEAAIAEKAEVIGISAMMTHTAKGENGCLGVRRLLKDRKLEDNIKIIVGGAPYRFDEDLYKTVQADEWAIDGITAGKTIARMITEARYGYRYGSAYLSAQG